MNIRWPTLLLLWGVFLHHCDVYAAVAPLRLSRASDTFFVEDDQVYARALWFQKDGTYRQINRDRTSSEEVDRGTWTQSGTGEVALHPTNGRLCYRALSAGPLLVILASQEQIDTLPMLRAKIAGFLQAYQDQIFSRSAATELVATVVGGAQSGGAGGACVVLPDRDETINRSDLENLLPLIDLWSESRSSSTFVFDLVAPPGGSPQLLIQRGAVFSRVELTPARTHAGLHEAPSFYFAQVSRQVFLRQVGTWKPFENLGGLHAPDIGPKPTP